MIRRALNLQQLVNRRSLFLFGPRQTGKTTILRESYPDACYLSLLDSALFRRLSAAPERLRAEVGDAQIVILDEIQRLPGLLNEVQLLIDSHSTKRFIMTGSSAVKLKRSGVNLLGGRALYQRLHPLCSAELSSFGAEGFDRSLVVGGLPPIFLSDDPFRDLLSYVGLYLQEEVRAESLVRSIEAFSRFLEVAGLTNGEQVNFTKVGSDAQVPARTVGEFYRLLEETMLGYLLQPFSKTRSRKVVSTPKFFFFDSGVAQSLIGKSSPEITRTEFGKALEHRVFLELRTYLDYHGLNDPLTFWRSRTQLEVDFVVGSRMAVEVKSASTIDDRDLRGLRALAEDVSLQHRIVACTAPKAYKTDDGIDILPIAEFLNRLWANELVA